MPKSPAQLDREIKAALASRHSHAVRARKTKDLYVVQGNYGYGHGWEDLTAEETRTDIVKRLREYRENEPGGSFRWRKKREKIATPAAHARKKKMTPQEAKRLLESEGIDFSRDYHASVSMSQGNRIAEVAKQAGYRKSKGAPGSTARMYFQYLSRLGGGRSVHATKRSNDKHTVYDLYELNTITKRERTLHEHFSNKKDANEAAKEYRDLKRPDFKYLIKPRKVARRPYLFNLED
jgi:hypothetical protein